MVAAARLVLALAVLGLAIPSAAAAQAQPDPSFGEDGVVHVDPPLTAPYDSQYISHLAAGRDGSSYVLAQQLGCTDPQRRQCRTALNLFRYGPDGSLDPAFGGPDGFYEVPQANGGLDVLADSKGRPVTVQDLDNRVIVRRLTLAGRPDPSFGREGVATLRCRCGFGLGAVTGPRGTMTLVQFPDERGSVARPLTLYRLRDDGSLDPRFGHGGVAELAYHAKALFPTGATSPDGALYFAGRACCHGQTFFLTRVSASGEFDRRFTRTTRRSLRLLEAPDGDWSAVRTVLVRPGGTIDLLGRTPDRKGGFEMRLKPDGRPQRSFGNGGVRTSRLPINAAALASDGSIFTLYTEFEGVRKISRLLPDGRRDPAFGVAALPESKGDYLLSLVPQARGGVLVLDVGERECSDDCPYQPKLIRYLPVGPSRVR